jgi:hypothetical protein
MDGCSWPTAIAANQDTAFVVWLEGSWPGRIMAAALARGGTSLSPPFEVTDPLFPTRRTAPRAAALKNGKVVVVWGEAVGAYTRAQARWVGLFGPLSVQTALDGTTGSHELGVTTCAIDPDLALCAWERGSGETQTTVARWIGSTGATRGDILALGGQSPSREPAVAPVPVTHGAAWAVWSVLLDPDLPEAYSLAARPVCSPPGLDLHTRTPWYRRPCVPVDP